MYFATGLPKIVNEISNDAEDAFQYLCCNRERILLLILKKFSIAVWQLRPVVQLTAYRRSETSIKNLGFNLTALWKPDSSAIVLLTSESGLIFFRIDSGSADNGCYALEDANNSKRESDELFIKEPIPYISIVPTASIIVSGGIECLESLRDNVMVSCKNGLVQRIQWDGVVRDELTIVLNKIPFSVDFPQSKKSYLSQTSVYVIDLDYSFLLGGFSLVLSTGRGALMTATHFEFLPETVQCVWIPPEVSPFTCTAVNHKYRLMAFGCQNSQGALFCIEEQTEGILLTHRLELLDKDCPDMVSSCGAVEDLNWTPDGCALAMIWKRGGFAIWSVFGALMSFSLNPIHEGIPRLISGLDWGTEGYTLWLMDSKMIFVYNFVKSALAMNNCSTNRMYVLLQGEQCLMLNTGDRVLPQGHSSTTTSADIRYRLFSNKSWTVIQFPHRYTSTNWPLRYAVVDAEADSIAVAGRHGLAYYTITTRKWKTFSNDTAEQLFVVTGGLLWWRDFVICACYNVKNNRDEVRCYPKNKAMDHTFAVVWISQASVVSLNAFRDMLLVFSVDSMLTLCGLERKAGDVPAVVIHVLQVISLENISPHPNCVVSIDLTSVRAETGLQRKHTGIREAESLLINVSGRLWIIQRDTLGPNQETKDDGAIVTASNVTPLLLSSCVETLWVHPGVTSSKERPQLSEALWMFCGAHGMKVWVPLFAKDGKKPNFFLRRIMLPVRLKIFPLCVLFDEAMVHGAESDIMFDFVSGEEERHSLPSFAIQRTSEVYLPQVLRQLLRRNLGAHALEIAQTCMKLPYFNHTLELLLHQVLEEEGTSSEPTPDPLLPSVVAFVQEFPVVLQTIAHCARKSDIALWPRLFAEAGEPVDLFRECLDSNQLHIAASFLIVLNSTLPIAAVRKQATQLLEKAKISSEKELVTETARFLKALEMDELEGQRRTPDTPPISSKSPTALHTSSEGLDFVTPISPQGTTTFKYGPVVRNRTVSESVHGKTMVQRTNSIPVVKDDRSLSVVSAPAAASLGIILNAVPPPKPDAGSSSNYFLNGLRLPSPTGSVVSVQKWGQRRFPGYAQVYQVPP